MNTQTELLLDYQEAAIIALREEVERLKIELLVKTEETEWLENRILTNEFKNNESI